MKTVKTTGIIAMAAMVAIVSLIGVCVFKCALDDLEDDLEENEFP